MDTLVHVDLIEEATQLTVGISIVHIVRQVNFFFLDGADETFGVAILPGSTEQARARTIASN